MEKAIAGNHIWICWGVKQALVRSQCLCPQLARGERYGKHQAHGKAKVLTATGRELPAQAGSCLFLLNSSAGNFQGCGLLAMASVTLSLSASGVPAMLCPTTPQ